MMYREAFHAAGLGAAVLACALAAASGAFAQQAPPQGIYTCVDAQGRRLTSDRPILECIDREQRELSGSGTVRRTIKPTLTPDEAAALEEKERKLAEERKRLAEEKRRERLLVQRFPDRATHDREREAALMAVEGVIAAALKITQDLQVARRKLNIEGEFYKHDRSKMPSTLRRQFEQNDQAIEAQNRFILNQEEEKKRVSVRFDEDLAKLQRLWRAEKEQAAAAAPRAAASTARPASR